jgi:hypothetical protein
MTLEALDAIKRAEKVHFVAADLMMDRWVRELNPTSERLAEYIPDRSRRETYRLWTDTVLESVREGLKTCAVTYGHPGVFVQFTRDAIREAREDGFSAKMLPGISAEACLICDLGVDPGPQGWQSYGATVFVKRRPRFDVRVPLILWQLRVIDQPQLPTFIHRDGLMLLAEVLAESYGPEHEVKVYEASKNPASSPIIRTVSLSRLGAIRFRQSATLYVPPSEPSSSPLESNASQ